MKKDHYHDHHDHGKLIYTNPHDSNDWSSSGGISSPGSYGKSFLNGGSYDSYPPGFSLDQPPPNAHISGSGGAYDSGNTQMYASGPGQTSQPPQGYGRSMKKKGNSMNRRDIRMVTGLLTGHCHLSRHLQLIGIAEDPECRWCLEDEETSSHILTECPAMGKSLKGQRTALWEQCSEPGRCQEDSAQEAMHLCQRGEHTWLRHSKECGCTMGPLGGLRARDLCPPTV
ncbi:hypothetical protein NQ317_015963 [Molorchus minor]|uniref:Reverse transcriptase zinc-binding domain-containing protein n=1 Tax=Molorchus minor TaxID=1323400 RepID=A0ABQ9JKK7_9CUCU|nr:hypothetical protein NQ317_015963 [Molorchus minor]